jgi:hypothetical protein
MVMTCVQLKVELLQVSVRLRLNCCKVSNSALAWVQQMHQSLMSLGGEMLP